ncbi:uncharacterized protein LOC141714841 [Apium graveolens]|uniref:uncharacterized protein LOC141714841 n=1 Tax=Apium graveolens TaxID=4045 RepID=UPI003D78C92E
MDINKAKEGGVGMSYPMLTRNTYTTWAIKLRVFMQDHGVWIAVEPKDPKTPVEERIDKVALAAIYQGISEDVFLSVADKTTTKEAWEAVKTMSLGAERVKKAKVQTLKSEFESLKMKDTESLDDFCLKLNGLVANIRTLGKIVEETTQGWANEPTGGQLLFNEDEWVRRENNEGRLFFTREKWLKRSSQKNRGNTSDSRSKDGSRVIRDKSKVRCFTCGIYGHFAAECRKSKKEKERMEVNMSQTQDEELALLMATCDVPKDGVVLLNEEKTTVKLSSNTDKADSNICYLDNGASNHMTGQLSKFKELNGDVTGQVHFGDGSTVSIQGKGSISFKCKNREEKILHEVYYIPNLCNNIISLGQLAEDGNKVVLNGSLL